MSGLSIPERFCQLALPSHVAPPSKRELRRLAYLCTNGEFDPAFLSTINTNIEALVAAEPSLAKDLWELADSCQAQLRRVTRELSSGVA